MDIKKTAFGTAAAAALVLAGAAAPATASSGDSESHSYSKWSSYASHKSTEITISPEFDVLGGDIANGNAIGSGNDLNAPLLSGNETAIGNGNETAIGNVSGNNVSDVVDTTTEVGDVLDTVTDVSIGDLVDANDILGDVGGWVDIDGMFED